MQTQFTDDGDKTLQNLMSFFFLNPAGKVFKTTDPSHQKVFTCSLITCF